MKRLAWVLCFVPGLAGAWVFSEHRDISTEAWPADGGTLDALWRDAVGSADGGICASPVDGSDACVDFPALVALAGDHACTPAELWQEADGRPWVIKVVKVGTEMRRAFEATVNHPSEREQAWVQSNFSLQDVDPKYVVRARANHAHFLLARDSPRPTLEDYLAHAVDPLSPLNAAGLYARLHAQALDLAAQLPAASDAERTALARRTLSMEAFALHFLEDGFAAGHYAGTWGEDVWRKGTHDYYSVHGLSTITWRGDLFESHGDAHSTESERAVVAASVRKSLTQLAAATHASQGVSFGLPEPFDVCADAPMPPGPLDHREAVLSVLENAPVPAGGEHDVHPPRMRAEVGPFFSTLASTSIGAATNGYETNPGSLRGRATLEVAARAGYAVEGFLTSGQDGMFWVQASFVADPPQLDTICNGCAVRPSSFPRVEARASFRLALRMPFWIVPGDLLLLAPILAPTNRAFLQRVLFDATAGGFIPWERRFATRLGTFQIIAGREFALTPNGYIGTNFFCSDPQQTLQCNTLTQQIQYKSLEFDFPLLEYMPYRIVQTELALGSSLQIGTTIELERDTVPHEHLGPSYLLYVRLAFEGRRYF